MFKRNIALIPIFFIVLIFSLMSCGEDRWAEYAPRAVMDEWMDSLMRVDYYWYGDLPSSKRMNYFLAPASFLTSVKSSIDKVSRVDTVPVKTTDSYGIKAIFELVEDTTYNAVVTYVMSDSPAARAGLKRGDWIMQVNGSNITSSKRTKILSSGGAVQLTMGTYTTTTTDGTTTSSVVASGKTLDMEASAVAIDHPVNYYTTLTAGTEKVGYLVYGNFTSGTSDAYNNELRKVFASFKSDAVGDVVLDLRYNTGGDDMESAQLLATMLVPSSAQGKTFLTLTHATTQSSKDKTLTFDWALIGSGANLNLSRVYILTTAATAQLSEALITALVPYMNVYLVGAGTGGYMGVNECFSRSGYPYNFYLTTCLAVNADSETYTSSGISATTATSDTSVLNTLLPFGDSKETMLAAALTLITAK